MNGETFHSIALAQDRKELFRLLSNEAAAYFGHGGLFMRGMRVAVDSGTGWPVTYLGEADFSEEVPA